MDYRIEKSENIGNLSAEELQHRMEQEGFRVFTWSDRPGTTYPVHAHLEDQSHLIISGRLELHVEGHGTVLLEPGDRDFMPAGKRHSARVIGDEPAVYLVGAKVSG